MLDRDIFWAIFAVFFVFTFYFVICWGISRVFLRSGIKPGLAYVPVVNYVYLFEVAGLSKWLALLMFVPIASLIMHIVVAMKVCERFQVGAGYAFGLVFLPYIFYPLLGSKLTPQLPDPV